MSTVLEHGQGVCRAPAIVHFERRIELAAFREGYEIVARSFAARSFANQNATIVLWHPHCGLVARSIYYDPERGRWIERTDCDLAKDVIRDAAYEGIMDEAAAQGVIWALQDNEEAREELIRMATEHVDQYGADAYHAGRLVLKWALQDEPELFALFAMETDEWEEVW